MKIYRVIFRANYYISDAFGGKPYGEDLEYMSKWYSTKELAEQQFPKFVEIQHKVEHRFYNMQKEYGLSFWSWINNARVEEIDVYDSLQPIIKHEKRNTR